MEEDPAVREAVWAAFEDGDLSFLFHDGQLDMLDIYEHAESDEILIFCSRQFGKSFFILCIAIAHCARHPRALVRIFCHTVQQANDIVADNMAILEQLAPPGFIRRMKSERRWKIGPGQIRIGPLAAAHVDGKRGGNATLVITEEGGFTPSSEYQRAIGSVINPQLLRSGGRLVHVTTPSEDEIHYIHSVVLPKCERKGALARKTIYENPQLTDRQIEQAFERCTSLAEWEREYLTLIKRSEITTVIPEFNEDLHVRDFQFPLFAYWQTSLDFGGVRDPHGVLATFNDFDRDKLCVSDERFLPKNTPTPVIKAETLEMEKSVRWLHGMPWRVSDCPGQILVDLRFDDFNVRTPEKGEGSWEAGINMVRAAFRRGEIEVHPRCVNLIRQLKHGKYNEQRTDFLRTEEMGHLDLIMALVYALRHRCRMNPWPQNHGKDRLRHHVAPSRTESVLDQALIPDYLK